MASPRFNHGYMRYDGLFNVLLKSNNGDFAKHPSDRNVDHGFDLNFQMVCINIDLYLRND